MQEESREATAYQYEPLQNVRCIRLLEIQKPESSVEPMECKLTEVLEEPAPRYAALSYTWGEPIFDHEIRCNGSILKVTANLESALRNIPNAFPVWVDAICINQSDLEERSQQVQRMKQIYSSAQIVLIWLGEAEPAGAVPLVDLLFTLAEIHDSKESNSAHTLLEPTGSSNLGLPERSAAQWHLLNKLFNRPWYRRAWVLQEISVAKACVVVWHDELLPWRVIAQAAAITLRMPYLAPTTSPFVLEMENMRIRLAGKSNVPLQDVLRTASMLNSTDPRDKIYAMLGLADVHYAHRIIPNYKCSVKELYTHTAHVLIEADRNLDTLCATSPTSEHDLPSWVPDWITSRNVLGQTHPLQRFFAAGRTQASVLETSDPEILAVQGFTVDTLAKCGFWLGRATQALTRVSLNQNIEFKIILKDWLYMASLIDTYPTGESVHDALWRTLIANRGLDGQLVETGYRQAFVKMGSQLLEADSTENTEDTESDLPGWTKDGHEGSDIRAFMVLIEKFCLMRSFALTKGGYMGLVPHTAEPGDAVCIFLGGQTTFILRAVNDHWILVGEAYIHGLMDGEALESGDLSLQTFYIH